MAILLSTLFFCVPALADTYVVGDSLALGTGQALHAPTSAKVGISSCAIVSRMPKTFHDNLVISAGTNDPPGRCVKLIRSLAHARVVIWILPVNGARGTVANVAARNGDYVVPYKPQSRNNVHPASYAPLAREIRSITK